MSASIQTVSREIAPGIGGRIRWTLTAAIVVVLLAGTFLIGRLTAPGTTVYKFQPGNAQLVQPPEGQLSGGRTVRPSGGWTGQYQGHKAIKF